MTQANEGQQAANPTTDQLLAATTPEALAELMAQAGAAPHEGVTAPAPAPAQADAAPAPAPAAESASPGAGSDDQPAAGVATKSGKGVLPYTVLQQERQERQHWKTQALTLQERLQQAEAELQDLRNRGTTQQQADALADLTDDEIEAASADYPLLGRVARALKSMPRQVAAPAQAPAPAPADPQDQADDTAAAVHAAMEPLPLLSKWQQTGGVVWARAVELDNALQSDPEFRGRSLSERFAEVQTRLAAELGMSVPSASPAPAPAPTAAAPAPQPEPFRPNTLSDLQGGARTAADPINADADGMALARRFSQMSPDQIAAAIRRSA